VKVHTVPNTLTRLATLGTLSPRGVPWAGEGLWRQTEQPGQRRDAAVHVEIAADPRLAGLAKRPPQGRAADHPFERCR
jgi:hypothetical protein